MTTKAMELKLAAEGRGCLGRSRDDEPIFVLCGRDPFAPIAIEAWCDAIEKVTPRGMMSDAKTAKIKEARELAASMIAWRRDNPESAQGTTIAAEAAKTDPIDAPFTDDRE